MPRRKVSQEGDVEVSEEIEVTEVAPVPEQRSLEQRSLETAHAVLAVASVLEKTGFFRSTREVNHREQVVRLAIEIVRTANG